MKLSVVENGLVDKNVFDKSNVAWFKLAEFVGRKEKERALGVYRLLSHSLPDSAFAAQLEGDLFMAFNDEKALEAYSRSAKLYEKNGRSAHAALIYEQMIMIKPENKDYFIQAIKLYELLKNQAKVARCASQLVRLLIKHSSFSVMQDFIASLACSLEVYVSVQESAAFGLIELFPQDKPLIQKILCDILDIYKKNNHFSQELTLFFAKLSLLDSQWYDYASCYIIT